MFTGYLSAPAKISIAHPGEHFGDSEMLFLVPPLAIHANDPLFTVGR